MFIVVGWNWQTSSFHSFIHSFILGFKVACMYVYIHATLKPRGLRIFLNVTNRSVGRNTYPYLLHFLGFLFVYFFCFVVV